jgi:hypothetical protein
MNMTRRFAARIILASALLAPVVAGAAPGRLPQAPQVPAGQSELSLTVDPLDPQHARLAFKLQDDETMVYDASSVNMTYTSDGLAVDMKGPGTLRWKDKTTPVDRTRLTFKDGKLVKLEELYGPRTFPCPPARNVGQPGCAGGSSSGSD